MTKNTTHTTVRFAVLTVALYVAPLTMTTAQAQTVLQFDESVDVNERGEATFEIKMSFNAQQFQVWQQKYGMNPSLLRREVGKTLSAYEITDFRIDKNDMEREVNLTIKAVGVTRNMGDGLVEMDVPKDWRLVNQNGPEMKFNFLESIGNGTSIQHHVTVNLPESATDVSDPFPAAAGQKRFTYRQPTTSRSSMPLILGIVLAAMGAGAIGTAFVIKPKAA